MQIQTSAFTSVGTARTAIEADMLLSVLRAAGLHPRDISTSSHFSIAGVDISFPIEVPAQEADAAREILSSHRTDE